MTTPQQYVQNKAAASGSSFYYAFLFLPKDRRAAITAFYAFCREVDDVVDEVSDPGVAATKLAWWQSEVRKSFAGQPSHPVMQALMPHASAFSIQAEHLLAVIEGCQMDLEQTRYLDFPGLQRYGVTAHEILERASPWGYSDRFDALMRFQAERAHRMYDEAFALLPDTDRRAQKPGLMMGNIYRTLLREIEADGFRVLHQRTSLTPLRKLWIAWRTHWRGR